MIDAGDSMNLIEVKPIQSHMYNIGFPREPSDPKIFIVNSTIFPLNSNAAPKTLQQRLVLDLTTTSLQPLIFNQPPQ